MKRIASWLAVFCLWTAILAVWPGTAVAEVSPGFEAAQETTTYYEAAPTGQVGNGGAALPGSAIDPGSVDTENPQLGGFRGWWQKQGSTLLKGLGIGLIGAVIVGVGAAVASLGAPLALAAAGAALLGGAIYGATVDPGSFNGWKAFGVSLLSGAGVAVGGAGLKLAVGSAAKGAGALARASGLRSLFGIARGTATRAPRQGLIKAALEQCGPKALAETAGAGGAIGAVVSGGNYLVTAGDDFTVSGLAVSTLSGAALGAVSAIPGVRMSHLAATGAVTGAGGYAATVVTEHVFHGKEMPSTGEFIRDSALAAGSSAAGAVLGGSMPSKSLRRGFTSARKHYTAATRAKAEADVILSTMRGAGATFGSTKAYQHLDKLLDDAAEDTVEE